MRSAKRFLCMHELDCENIYLALSFKPSFILSNIGRSLKFVSLNSHFFKYRDLSFLPFYALTSLCRANANWDIQTSWLLKQVNLNEYLFKDLSCSGPDFFVHKLRSSDLMDVGAEKSRVTLFSLVGPMPTHTIAKARPRRDYCWLSRQSTFFSIARKMSRTNQIFAFL